MDFIRKTSLIVAASSLLAACAGENQTAPPIWEQVVDPGTAVTHISASQADISADAFGDLVTLGSVISDADPSTPALDNFRQLFLMKQDDRGNLIWSTLLDYPVEGGSPMEVESDRNGNLYLVGEDFVMKTDRYGQVQWLDTFEDLALSITVTDDRIYVPGRTTRIYDLNGNLQLTIDNGDIYPWEVVIADNGDIIQATWTAITRHDSYGNLVWSAPAPADVTTLARIRLDAQENVYVSYLSNSGDSSSKKVAAQLIKVNANGTPAWDLFIPDRRPSSNYSKSGNVALYITANGELLNLTAGTRGRQITRINPTNGSVIWEKVYSGEGPASDSFLDSDDTLYIAGGSNPQKYDAGGNLLGTGEMRYTITGDSLAVTSSGMFVSGIVSENDVFNYYTVAFER